MPKKTAIDALTHGAPWAITEDALHNIITIAQRDNDIEAVLKQRGTPLESDWRTTTRGAVAIMPVSGPIFPKANLFTEISGATSIEMMALALGEIEHDPNIRALVLNIDSPGGNVTGVNEFSKLIAGFNKPVIAYVNGTAASAAYWIAAAASKVIIDDTARLGSIGVVAAFRSNRNADIEIVSSNAPDKRPDIQSDEGRAVVQKNIDALESVFIGHVARERGLAVEAIKSLRGGMMIGAEAIKAGLADEIGTLESVINQLETESMHIDKLKADHPEVYQAVYNQGAASASGEAIKTERGRIAAILTHEEAVGRSTLAQTLALETDMNAEQAAKVLAAASKEAPPAAPENRADNQFVKHMEALGNPKVGADEEQRDDDAESHEAVQKLWDKVLGIAK